MCWKKWIYANIANTRIIKNICNHQKQAPSYALLVMESISQTNDVALATHGRPKKLMAPCRAHLLGGFQKVRFFRSIMGQTLPECHSFLHTPLKEWITWSLSFPFFKASLPSTRSSDLPATTVMTVVLDVPYVKQKEFRRWLSCPEPYSISVWTLIPLLLLLLALYPCHYSGVSSGIVPPCLRTTVLLVSYQIKASSITRSL